MRLFKRLILVVSCFMLCMSSSISVHASTGSLVYKLDEMDDVCAVRVFRVAEFADDSYTVVSDFSKYMSDADLKSFSKLSSETVVAQDVQENAERLVSIAKEQNVNAYYSGDVEGSLSLFDLPLGMYLVVGEMKDSSKVLLPSLIKVPFDGMYDVVAYAKVGDSIVPDSKPDTSAQNHMYIYLVLLSVSSLGLFFLLRKKHEA